MQMPWNFRQGVDFEKQVFYFWASVAASPGTDDLLVV